MRLFCALALAGLLCACPGPDVSCTDVAPAKLSDVQASIFTPSCATSGCHRGSLPAQDLSLADGKSFGALVGVHSTEDESKVLVVPGDPGKSLLYSKTASGSMPQNLPALSQAQLDELRGWICAGALND